MTCRFVKVAQHRFSSPATTLQTALGCHTYQGLIRGWKAGRQQRKADQHPSDCLHAALHATGWCLQCCSSVSPTQSPVTQLEVQSAEKVQFLV